MKAILVGTAKHLFWQEVPNPVVGPEDVLIDIHAASVNRADLMQRAGDYPPPPGCPEWMGLEVAGVITAVGEKAALHRKVGDEVCALLGGGGYAEQVAVPWGMTMPIPKGLSMAEASALPEAFATAYLNLFYEGKAHKGETLLMHAGASGLASVIIPMARAYGLRVITSVMTDEAAAAIRHLKADRVIVTSREDPADVLKEELENGHGVDLVIDCLGGDMMGRALPHMNRGGRWIMIATLAGDTSCVNLKEMYKKNLRIIGNTLRSRTPAMKAEILAKLVDEVWPMVESGEVRPTIWKMLPIQQAEEAHAELQSGRSTGKVVLLVR